MVVLNEHESVHVRYFACLFLFTVGLSIINMGGMEWNMFVPVQSNNPNVHWERSWPFLCSMI